ncbi:MAG: hypothetical protein L6Q76_16540 [Polyangiaceae bacterium]|nr:hypothetical protein [Polyangiaceae bacterium]
MAQQSKQGMQSTTTATTKGPGFGDVGTQGIGSPISNEAYNVISALHAKLEGLEAYRKYSKDADAGLWQQLTQVECQGVELLVNELERLVHDGKFRMKEPGRGNA